MGRGDVGAVGGLEPFEGESGREEPAWASRVPGGTAEMGAAHPSAAESSGGMLANIGSGTIGGIAAADGAGCAPPRPSSAGMAAYWRPTESCRTAGGIAAAAAGPPHRLAATAAEGCAGSLGVWKTHGGVPGRSHSPTTLATCGAWTGAPWLSRCSRTLSAAFSSGSELSAMLGAASRLTIFSTAAIPPASRIAWTAVVPISASSFMVRKTNSGMS
mmetsp:Transcript_32832/g.81727  ORF Transcript_32832/g.81727 Transcript_32832/m.81727 type:complete len:216 (-) Transcript_32832:451-1098(-)